MKEERRYNYDCKQPCGREFHFVSFTPQGRLPHHRTVGAAPTEMKCRWVVGDRRKRVPQHRTDGVVGRELSETKCSDLTSLRVT